MTDMDAADRIFAVIKIPRSGKRLRDIEHEAILVTLMLTGWNQSFTARILQISRPTLSKKIKAYDIKIPERWLRSPAQTSVS